METTENNTVKMSNEAVVKDGKMMAIVSYITIIGLIIAFIMNNDKKNSFASYHIRQSLGLALTGLVALGVIGMVPILGWIIDFFGLFVMLYMWIMGLVNAVNENEKPVPILGKKYIEWLKNI